MKCPSCEKSTINRTYCDHCNGDIKLYNKVHMMAGRLYNEGLEQAQGRCLSGAIDTLTMCIRLKKDHIDALNLLGLIYWEVGEIGKALNYWIISASSKKSENLANDYLEKVQSMPGELTRHSDTMMLYNKALQYMSQGSEDIAIISLRKAVSQNHNYIEAKALLSLYYITENQEEKALDLLKAILEINKDHPKANKYWNALAPEIKNKQEEAQKEVIPKTTRVKPVMPKGPNTVIEPKSLRGNIIAFVLGVVCMFGIYAVLITPSKTSDLEDQIKAAQEQSEQIKNQLQAAEEEQKENIKILQEEKAALENENQALGQEQAKQQLSIDLQEVRNLSDNKQWVEAANKLSSINKEYLDENTTTQYDELMGQIYKKAGEALYNEGYGEYQSKNHNEAITLLEKSYLYAKEEWFSDRALYTIGRAYEELEDMEKAKEYYQLVIDNHPGTKSANNAKRRL